MKTRTAIRVAVLTAALTLTGCAPVIVSDPPPTTDERGQTVDPTPAPVTPAEYAFGKTLNLTPDTPEFEDAWEKALEICDQITPEMTFEQATQLPYSPVLIGAAMTAVCPAEMPSMN